MEPVYRPIDAWPGELTRRRTRSPFNSTLAQTFTLLERELRHLGARDVVVQMALHDNDFRIDGKPRARAIPDHPGVIVAFDSRYGPLKYATDTFDRFADNLRAIALGLESLRRVDRYGITKRGEQYAGWKALPAAGETTRVRGEVLIERHGSAKRALVATHPDTRDPENGYTDDDFIAVKAVAG